MTSEIEQKKPTGPASYSIALIVTSTYGMSTNLSGKDIFLIIGSQQLGAVNSITPFITDFALTIAKVMKAIRNRFCIIKIININQTTKYKLNIPIKIRIIII